MTTPLPADDAALRKTVFDILKGKDINTVTTKQLRRSLEQHLSLPEAALDAEEIKSDINKLIEDVCAEYLATLQKTPSHVSPKATEDKQVSSSSSSSELEDEPKKIKQKPRSRSTSKTSKKTKISDANAKKIESLKKYIVKCGVRKIWSKELAGLETAKQQIAHLQGILEQLGMKGRPTLEKCKEIRRRRELEAERDALMLDAPSTPRKRRANVLHSDEDDDEGTRPVRRRLTRTRNVVKTNIDDILSDSDHTGSEKDVSETTQDAPKEDEQDDDYKDDGDDDDDVYTESDSDA